MSRMRSTTLSPFHARKPAIATPIATAKRRTLRRCELILEELQYRHLVATQRRRAAAPRALARALFGERHDAALEIGLDQRRVNVILAAHRARIAQTMRDEIDRVHDV